jgi:hypothetical protein
MGHGDQGGSHDHGSHDAQGHDHQHGEDEAGSGPLAALGDLLRPHSHDSVAKIDAALESDAHGVRALKITLVALLLTASLARSAHKTY